MLKAEWYIDTFPSIVGLSTESEVVVESTDPSVPDGVESSTQTNSVFSKVITEECGGDEKLEQLCHRYCQVNKCEYSLGVATMLAPLAAVLSLESERLSPHLVAAHQYRGKFCAVVPSVRQHTYFKKSTTASTHLKLEAASSALVVSLVRFHRPGCAAVLESVFGINTVPDPLWRWVSTALVSACDKPDTARELTASIAATGDPATVALLATAALDEVITGLPIAAAEAVNEAIASFVLSADVLLRLWTSATEMASFTPSTFSHDYAAFVTQAGRDKLTKRPPSHTGGKGDNRALLAIPSEVIVGEILRSLVSPQASPKTDASNSSTVFSIAEDTGVTSNVSMDCVAGSAIAQVLRVFTKYRDDEDDDETSSDGKNWVCVDARTGAERELDDTVVVEPGVGSRLPSVSRGPSKDDWFNDDHSSGRASVDDVLNDIDPMSVRLVVHRLRNCLWVDPEVDLADESIADAASPASMFLRKLEFYRGNRLCLIGAGATCEALKSILLSREFPYVACLDGGFAALRASLVRMDNSAALIGSVAIVGSEDSAIALRKSISAVRKSKTVLTGLQSAFNKSALGSQITTMVGSIDTKDLKSRFSSFRSSFNKSVRKSQTPPQSTTPPIVVAPDPDLGPIPTGFLASLQQAAKPQVDKSQPRRSAAKAVAESMFEIGGEDEEGEDGDASPNTDRFSSIDLSPLSGKSAPTGQ